MHAHLYARTHAATRATHGVPALRARLTWPCVAEAASVADARVAELALGYCPSLFWVGLGEANELLKGGGRHMEEIVLAEDGHSQGGTHRYQVDVYTVSLCTLRLRGGG